MLHSQAKIHERWQDRSYFDEGKHWEMEFEVLRQVKREDVHRLWRWRDYLAGSKTADSYLKSPVYYAFTGRRGLWSFQAEGEAVFVCWHPNVDGRILILTPKFAAAQKTLEALLRVIPNPPNGLQIARVPEQAVFNSEVAMAARLVKKEETILDWRYPCHLLSTAKVYALRGGAFENIRGRLRQLKQDRLTVETLRLAEKRHSIYDLLHVWSRGHDAPTNNERDLLAPHQSILELLSLPQASLFAEVYSYDDTVEGISIYNVEGDAANAFTFVSNPEIKGLSEYQIYHMCNILNRRQVAHLNLGGSETPGLDRYKRKFAPEISYGLQTFEVSLRQQIRRPLAPLRKAA